MNGESQGDGPIGVAVAGAGGEEFEGACWGNDALQGGEVITDAGVGRDPDFAALHGFLGEGEDLPLADIGEDKGIQFVAAQTFGELFGDGTAEAGGINCGKAGEANAGRLPKGSSSYVGGLSDFLIKEPSLFEGLS